MERLEFYQAAGLRAVQPLLARYDRNVVETEASVDFTPE